MPSTSKLISYLRDRLLVEPTVVANNIGRSRIFNKMLSTVTDTDRVFPCLTLTYDADRTEIFADIVPITVYIEIHTKDATITDDLADAIVALYHRHTGHTDAVTVYMCHDQGGRVSPIFDSHLNTWGSLLAFDIKFG